MRAAATEDDPLAPAAALHAAGRTLAARGALPECEALAALPPERRALAEEIQEVAAAADAALDELREDESSWDVALDGRDSALRALYKHEAGTLLHSLKLEARLAARLSRACEPISDDG